MEQHKTYLHDWYLLSEIVDILIKESAIEKTSRTYRENTSCIQISNFRLPEKRLLEATTSSGMNIKCVFPEYYTIQKKFYTLPTRFSVLHTSFDSCRVSVQYHFSQKVWYLCSASPWPAYTQHLCWPGRLTSRKPHSSSLPAPAFVFHGLLQPVMQKVTQSKSAQFFIAQRKRILPPLLN